MKRDVEDEVTTLHNARKCNFNYLITKAPLLPPPWKRVVGKSFQWSEKQNVIFCLRLHGARYV